jgi:hypothetical protein
MHVLGLKLSLQEPLSISPGTSRDEDQGKALMQCGMEEKMQRTEGTMRVF